MATHAHLSHERMLLRIWGEYVEMPGLSLTWWQAQRLWGLDGETCLDLLESLVDAGFLVRRGRGDNMYVRRTDGPVEWKTLALQSALRRMTPGPHARTA